MAHFVIRGAAPLRGTAQIGGSKNAALPILAATLLTEEVCTIRNVPDIRDVVTMLELLRALGSEVQFVDHTVTIQTKEIRTDELPAKLIGKMRASVLLVGPLLARIGRVRMAYPGGCVLGARPIDTHLRVLEQMGISRQKTASSREVFLEGKVREGDVVFPEFSVTATENALMAAARTEGRVQLKLAASEPHVSDLARFLCEMGVHIEGIGTHFLTVYGRKKLRGASYKITSDYLEAGTLTLAAILTKGDVTLQDVPVGDLDIFFALLKEAGALFEMQGSTVRVRSSRGRLTSCLRLQTNVFPGFPTDLQPPFSILFTQTKGRTHIHEPLFEGRFAAFAELRKMGAKIVEANSHEAFIDGPTELQGTRVKSCDLRAGAAMILAGLVARGETVVEDIHYIDRGYERFDEKLRLLGADIERFDEENVISTVPSRSVRKIRPHSALRRARAEG